MRGHSRLKNGVASLAYDPRVHADVPQSRLMSKFNRSMDCRVKPGNDAPKAYFQPDRTQGLNSPRSILSKPVPRSIIGSSFLRAAFSSARVLAVISLLTTKSTTK